MSCYIVTYQVKELETRQRVRAALRKYPKAAAIHNHCWAVVTDKKAKQIRDELKAIVAADDRLFVVRSGTEAAWRNAIAASDWLKEYL